MKTFDKNALRILTEKLQAALDKSGLAAEYGLTLKIGNCSFMPTEAKYQLIVQTGAAGDAKKEYAIEMAKMMGVTAFENAEFELVDFKGRCNLPFIVQKKGADQRLKVGEAWLKAKFGGARANAG